VNLRRNESQRVAENWRGLPRSYMSSTLLFTNAPKKILNMGRVTWVLQGTTNPPGIRTTNEIEVGAQFAYHGIDSPCGKTHGVLTTLKSMKPQKGTTIRMHPSAPSSFPVDEELCDVARTGCS
jgi:hypothetical protein